MRLLLATNNPHKHSELRRLLGQLPVELCTPAGLGLELDPRETGRSFEENSLIKARAFAERFDGLVLADDSGLEVEALGGAPGVRSSRYAGARATDAENRSQLLQELCGLPRERRAARFVCVLTLVRGSTVLTTIRGICEGSILEHTRGQGGFGYDSLFFHEPSNRSFAELEPAEKDSYSHRGVALKQLVVFLDRIGNDS